MKWTIKQTCVYTTGLFKGELIVLYTTVYSKRQLERLRNFVPCFGGPKKLLKVEII